VAAEVALEAGELDFGLISVPAVERFEQDPTKFEVITTPSLRYHWIGMNVENPKLEDIRVREAIRYAIDVPSILEASYSGYAEQEHALIPPDLIGHWANAPQYERDIERARELLADAGAEGLEIRIDLEDVTLDRIWAEIAAENLKEAGFVVELNPMDSSTYWTSSFGEQSVNNELFTSGYSMQPDPAWATMWFTCDQVNIWNAMRWCNEEYDALHRQGMTTTDPDARHELYIEMQELWDQAAHTVWLTHGVRPYAFTPDIIPAMTPHGFPQPQWFMPAQ
jgi:peptide/nickel transport system substrate-binding protein